ncbi:uncharacterized protein LOC126740505 [Anthonomus grandis grandis]|uniref:uncharacterized protein LOC126740505 n=1 Tax=Anthonomus grandis grandis TaxID=2921223 RepID=UPI00216698A3|nr:uncharacterized protein LOC126740505 [Anthonomus grandis grandis]
MFFIAITLCLITFIPTIYCDGYYDVTNWKYHFPTGSGMGIYAALALPVPDSGYIDLFCAVFFEAFYSLPDNTTELQFPPLVSDRMFGRKSLYESIEAKLVSKGHMGRSCLLKAICEVASYTVLHANGLVGDLVHLIFTPSSTKNEDETYIKPFIEAEETGWNTKNCEKYHCQISMLDLISSIKY